MRWLCWFNQHDLVLTSDDPVTWVLADCRRCPARFEIKLSDFR